ncbi:hypothetical protein OBE_09125, partial [human gut metagenome]
ELDAEQRLQIFRDFFKADVPAELFQFDMKAFAKKGTQLQRLDLPGHDGIP